MGAREIDRKDRFQIVKLRAEIEAERQGRRKRIAKIRLYGRIGGADFGWIFEFIVENRHCQRAICGDKGRRRAMRSDGSGIETRLLRKIRKTCQKEAPQRLDIIMRIGAVAEHSVRHAARGNFLAACRINHDDFGIGLADIENGDALHDM